MSFQVFFSRITNTAHTLYPPGTFLAPYQYHETLLQEDSMNVKKTSALLRAAACLVLFCGCTEGTISFSGGPSLITGDGVPFDTAGNSAVETIYSVTPVTLCCNLSYLYKEILK